MKLKLERIYKGKDYTIGKLYIDEMYFCDTLEDTDRGLISTMDLSEIKKIKQPGVTAIPSGEYKITLDVVSPKYSNYNRYSWSKEIDGKVPRLLEVKGFDGILIHPSGNKHTDTDGCLLVGENKVVGQVINSISTFKKLYNILLTDKDNLSITIS